MTSRSESSSHGDPATADRVSVGRILGAHGIRGEVAVEVLTDLPERYAAGSRLLLTPSPSRLATGSRDAAGAATLTVVASRPHKGALLVRFSGVDDRDAAEALRGAWLEVGLEAVPPPPDGSYYHFQLVGCRCTDRVAGELGEVREVVEDGGGVLLRVVGPAGEVLLPFVDPFLVDVDVEGHSIVWALPEGLIEACGSAS